MFKRNMIFLLFFLLIFNNLFSQEIDEFYRKLKFSHSIEESSKEPVNRYLFDGYSNKWEKFGKVWHRHNNLFGISVHDISEQIKIAENECRISLGFPHLYIQEGFIHNLIQNSYTTLKFPDISEIKTAIENDNLLLLIQDEGEIYNNLSFLLPADLSNNNPKAVILNYENRKVFLICSINREQGNSFIDIMDKTVKLCRDYDFYKGWAGVNTNYRTISTWVENPFDLIEKALQERCSWVLLSGYNDYLVDDIVNHEFNYADFDFLVDAGQQWYGGVMYGMDRYPNIQFSPMDTCVQWTRENNGLIFRNPFLQPNSDYIKEGYNENPDEYQFDGYVIQSGQDEFLLNIDKPFITNAGALRNNYPPSMLIFLKKGEILNKENLFRAVLDKREVGIFPGFKISGYKEFTGPLRLLFLEKLYLIEKFSEKFSISSEIRFERLYITVSNNYEIPKKAVINFFPSSGINLDKKWTSVEIPANSVVNVDVPFSINPVNVDKENVIISELTIDDKKISSLSHIYIPPAIECYSLNYFNEGDIQYPITYWNYKYEPEIKLSVDIFKKELNVYRSMFHEDIDFTLQHGLKREVDPRLNLEEGDYKIKISDGLFEKEAFLSVRFHTGEATTRFEDLNGDGMDEIIMENDKIRAAILRTGGRVIEYILKEKNDNLLFKIWPEKPDDWSRPNRKTAFWPYGGLEEFIGYPTITGHEIFEFEILKDRGKYVQVKLWADINGNRIEKILTLFGDGTVLEAKYRLSNMNPELNIMGVNPLIELGESAGIEDYFHFPSVNGLDENTIKPHMYYGKPYLLNEGWAAGYDTNADISLLVAFDVNLPFIFHLWHNTPKNRATPYYYTELQPWLLIKHKTDTYFTYYLVGYNGYWRDAVREIEKLNLLTLLK